MTLRNHLNFTGKYQGNSKMSVLNGGMGKLKKNAFLFEKKRLDKKVQEVFSAIVNGDFTKTQNLLDKRGDVNMKSLSKMTPLIAICHICTSDRESDAIPVVLSLLKRGSKVDAVDIFGKNAAYYADKNGLRKIKQLLCSKQTENLLQMFFD